MGAAIEHPGNAVGDVQLLFGAGNAHISQTAFLLKVRFGILAHFTGEYTLFHSNEEHVRELKALCGVNGHQHHLICALVVAVDIADEGDIFQIAFQRGFLTVLVAVVLDVVHQLTKVLQAVCRVLVAFGSVRFQHCLIAGQLDHIGCKFVQRAGFQRVLQALVDLPELEQRHYGTAELCVLVGVADDIQHTHALLPGQIGNDLHRGGTDLAGRLVDDAAQAHIIARVRYNRHIGVDVLDLFAVIEALAAHDLVRDACAGKVAFDGGRLGIHTVQNSMICQMSTRFQVLADHIRDVAGLILLIFGGVHLHLVTLAVVRP